MSAGALTARERAKSTSAPLPQAAKVNAKKSIASLFNCTSIFLRAGEFYLSCAAIARAGDDFAPAASHRKHCSALASPSSGCALPIFAVIVRQPFGAIADVMATFPR
jgi:hypothetical protein